MRYAILLVALCGCGTEAIQVDVEKPVPQFEVTIQNVAKTSEAILSAVKQNDTSIKAVWTKLEALDLTLSTLKPQTGKDGDLQSSPSPPESPAKANDTPNPLKVATPGTSQESLVELASRLYAQGVNPHMKTREELEAIDAKLKAGQPVTGAIFQNNGTSAITSQRSAVRFVPRGSGFVQWQNNSTQQSCGPNGCPPRRSR